MTNGILQSIKQREKLFKNCTGKPLNSLDYQTYLKIETI